jgi:hypothetical protein
MSIFSSYFWDFIFGFNQFYWDMSQWFFLGVSTVSSICKYMIFTERWRFAVTVSSNMFSALALSCLSLWDSSDTNIRPLAVV